MSHFQTSVAAMEMACFFYTLFLAPDEFQFLETKPLPLQGPGCAFCVRQLQSLTWHLFYNSQQQSCARGGCELCKECLVSLNPESYSDLLPSVWTVPSTFSHSLYGKVLEGGLVAFQFPLCCPEPSSSVSSVQQQLQEDFISMQTTRHPA